VNGRVAAETTASVGLRCGTLAPQWDGAICSRHIPVRQIRAAVKVLRVITGVTTLAQHRNAHLQQRRKVGSVRRVAGRASVHNWLMLPQKRTALLCVARVTRLVDRLFYQKLRTVRAVRVVAARTRNFSFKDRMP